MSESKCHSWTNWETWLANEWLTADEESQARLEDIANDSNLEDWEKSDTLKDWVESESPASSGLFADFINEHLKRIDWEEIIESHTEEDDEEDDGTGYETTPPMLDTYFAECSRSPDLYEAGRINRNQF